ncbi:MAG TPA: glycosyltransferase family 39 protein [Bacteroidales bacterium]|mgnify:CR=1 FL=1|nr:glycosyltransferase family 39 protein [Bacteroidales bacterium]
MKLSNKIILILIIIVACVLRFYNLFEIPYTHDEFSALFRTRFDTFSELIEKGVIVDTLPAGVQVFLYYWIKIFGEAEWIVKLPFILCGVFSVYLIYIIARKWYNETLALISASFLASIQFTVFYSQIARPYISGLFFSLLMVNALTDLVKSPEKRFYLNSLIFILSAAACSYNHHFSLVFAAIAGISGLFLLQRKYLPKYLACCFLIMLIYVPHINIILSQLQLGGNENWLGKFQSDFFVNYIAYIFQFSKVTGALVILLILYGLIKIKKQDFKFRQFILFACWFFLPFVVGLLYSKFVNNVMQYSVLIFSFPFLFFILFGHIKPQRPIINLVLVLLILSVNTYALTMERKHYSSLYDSAYIHILTDRRDAGNLYKHMASLIDSDKEISEFYIKKLNLDTSFTWVDTGFSQKELISYLEVQSHSCRYLYFGCLSDSDPVTVAVIQDYYPSIVQQKNYFGGTTYIFSRTTAKADNIIECHDFETKEKKYWSSVDKNKFTDTLSFSGNNAYRIDSSAEFSLTYTRPLQEIVAGKYNFIDISVETFQAAGLNDATLVASIEAGDSVINWSSSEFSDFLTNKSSNEGWVRIHHTLMLYDIPFDKKDLLLKIYIWNPGRKSFLIDDFTIRLRAGNPVIYSWYQKI